MSARSEFVAGAAALCAYCIVWACAAILIAMVPGCGSPIATAARGVETVAHLLAPTMTAATTVRAAELDACERLPVGEDLACAEAGEVAWQPRVDALNALRDSLAAVVAGLEAARLATSDAPTREVLFGLARAALAAWIACNAILKPAGLSLPKLPDEVIALIGGAS